MSLTVRRLILWGVLGAMLAGGIVYALRPQPVSVDLALAEVRHLRASIDDEGEVRVRDVYTLHAPVSGRLQRIEAQPGDVVEADRTELARIEAAPPAFLDVRTEAERAAAVDAALAARDLAVSELESAEANLAFAAADVERARALMSQQVISRRSLDEAERTQRVARAAVATAKAALKVRDFELQQARSRLMSGSDGARRGATCCLSVSAPVNGVVLRVLRRSEGVIEGGTALVEIGNPHDLEVVVDLLSEDAVRIVPGQRAVITGWGGPDLAAVVRRIEPFGRAKVSALGIEEQRVDVVLDPVGPAEDWHRLGHGYRVDVRLIQFESDVLTLPIGALFRTRGGDGWAVFVVEDGRARLRTVDVGQRNDLIAEVRGGLAAGARVVLYPSERIADGIAVAQR